MSNDIDVLVFGSANVDFITYVNELPKQGETQQAMHREQCFGGKGANQCVAAAKLGASCALIAKLGADELGNQYYEYLNDLGIDMDYVEQLEGYPTGIAQINVNDNGENTIVVLSGANTMLKSKEVGMAKKPFKRARVLLCQLETDHKGVLCALQQFKGISVLNAAPASNDIAPELITAPTILCVNEIEAAQLTNREEVKTLQDARAAAIDLVDMGAKSVIITMGDLGAVYLSGTDRDRCIHCPAAPVRYVADTSGAGDAFLGSLAYHMARFPNLDRESHIHAANICAAHSVGQRGTQPSFPDSALAQNDLCMIEPNFTIIEDEPAKDDQKRTGETVGAVPAESAAASQAVPETETKVADSTAPEPAAEPKQAPSPQPEPVVSPEQRKSNLTEPEQITSTPEPVAGPEERKSNLEPVPEPEQIKPTPAPVAAPVERKSSLKPAEKPEQRKSTPEPKSSPLGRKSQPDTGAESDRKKSSFFKRKSKPEKQKSEQEDADPDQKKPSLFKRMTHLGKRKTSPEEGKANPDSVPP